jgi:hypothetical protein
MEAPNGVIGTEKEGSIVATIGIFELSSDVVLDSREARGVAVLGSAVKEKLVDGVEWARKRSPRAHGKHHCKAGTINLE